MRIFKRRQQDDRLDPELLALFEAETRLPELDDGARMRARAAVAGRLVQDAPGSRGFFRRFALAGLGGGGLWASLAGVAAAHKATAAAVGVTAVLGGSLVAAEAGGVGPSVRGALGISQPPAAEQQQPPAQPGDAPGALGPEPDVGPPAEDVERAGDDEGPGNFVTHQRADGSFTMRALLIDVDGTTLTLEVAGASEHELTLAEDAVVQGPGPRGGGEVTRLGGTDLGDFVGHLVFASGTCPAEAESVGDGCAIRRLQVLGHAGQEATRPGDAGPPDLPGTAGDAGRPGGAGQPDDTGHDEQPAQRFDVDAPVARQDAPGTPETTARP